MLIYSSNLGQDLPYLVVPLYKNNLLGKYHKKEPERYQAFLITEILKNQKYSNPHIFVFPICTFQNVNLVSKIETLEEHVQLLIENRVYQLLDASIKRYQNYNRRFLARQFTNTKQTQRKREDDNASINSVESINDYSDCESVDSISFIEG